MASPEMWVLALRLDLGIPGARSLKDRRQVVRSLKERLMARFGVHCAEVGELESWVRASLGLTACSNDQQHLREMAEALVRYARQDPGALVGNVVEELWQFSGSANDEHQV